MKKLYFIRHGQSQLNVEGRYAGRAETPLTDEGRTQAKRTGQDAKGLKIDLIVSSPLSRALETAQIVAAEIGYPLDKIIADERFTERDFGKLEGQIWSPTHKHQDLSPYNIETDQELLARTRKTLDWLESQPANSILVVSHGAFGRALRSLFKADFPMSHPHRLGNAELNEWL
ncbi:MAG TPA: histidine phosphatase family protein [Candidatus Limnocylindria bacterium]|nr:histidine phosphatase family protein [Candidatus Limnocylindria bacterium]